MRFIHIFNDLCIRSLALTLAFFIATGCNTSTVMANGNNSNAITAENNTIRLALLLDTSNSMDGLIDQAKAQLWVIVNELTKARYNGNVPKLEIALYEYGNDALLPKENFIRQVTPFTSDLDTVSEQLFALKTLGGEEYCGAVIGSSLNQLQWSSLTNDFEVIVIAGNEPFTQGPVDHKITCAEARKKGIFINTIYCGDAQEGLNTGWKSGADIAGGCYMNIDQDKKTVYIQTPFDDAIVKLNDSLNKTYIPYGSLGEYKQKNQLSQDANAGVYTSANTVNRAKTKISGTYYNGNWDLVDASSDKNFDIMKIKDNDLPKELRGKTKEQKLAYIGSKKQEREKIKQEIKTINAQREKYISEKQLKEDKSKRLDSALIEALHKQALQRGYTFVE